MEEAALEPYTWEGDKGTQPRAQMEEILCLLYSQRPLELPCEENCFLLSPQGLG